MVVFGKPRPIPRPAVRARNRLSGPDAPATAHAALRAEPDLAAVGVIVVAGWIGSDGVIRTGNGPRSGRAQAWEPGVSGPIACPSDPREAAETAAADVRLRTGIPVVVILPT